MTFTDKDLKVKVTAVKINIVIIFFNFKQNKACTCISYESMILS